MKDAGALSVGVVFVITENNMREGGRRRGMLDAYLNVDGPKAAYLGDDPMLCLTDDGSEFESMTSGTHRKNFRSRHYADLGGWIKARCRALPGDEIHARWLDDQVGGVLTLSYVRKYALPVRDDGSVSQRRLERETEDALVARLTAAGIPVLRQVRCANGIIDVLTPDALYEVKSFLTRDAIYEALGQLSLYAVGTPGGRQLRRVIVGRQTRETDALLHGLEALGVEVDAWRD